MHTITSMEDSDQVLQCLRTLIGQEQPTLHQIWAALDFVWELLECDNRNPEPEKLAEFYRHPVWLLNGYFIEQDIESLRNRKEFLDCIAQQSPLRVADIGGGFGTLARMIASRCPKTQVDVVEPYPHKSARDKSKPYSNLKYVTQLSGEYDVLIATDVFEHVIDPLKLVEDSSKHLALGGKYLMANCFYPVIKCHLPSTFHFRISWDAIMHAMGLHTEKSIAYGHLYRKVASVIAEKGRSIERRSKFWFPIIERMPHPFKGALITVLFRQL